MGKRGNNEGSIYKRKDGRWEARIIVGYKEDGKPRYKSSYYPTKKAAQAYLQDTLYRVSRGMTPLDSTFTLDSWAETWLTAKRSTIEETTYSNYRFMLRHILPVLGKFKLTEIKTIQIQTLINGLHKAGNGRSTLEKVRSALYGMLQEAEINDMVLRNVCRDVKLPKKEKKQAKDAFSPDEVAIIEAHVGKIPFCDVIAVLVNTGLREGEMIALRKHNLDVETNTIHITHAAKRTKTTSMELGTPKTPESVRSIPVPPHLMDILVGMAAKRPALSIATLLPSYLRHDALRGLVRLGRPFKAQHMLSTQKTAATPMALPSKSKSYSVTVKLPSNVHLDCKSEAEKMFFSHS